MQSAVSEATGFVHYARAARFFPLVRFGIKVSEPVRQSGRGRGSPGWIVCAARACMERGSAMEAGLREAALAAPQGTARRGSAGGEARGAGMHGEEARHGSGLAGGRSCRPVRHSPKGTQGGGAARTCKGEGSAPWKRACGGRSCRPAGTARRGKRGRLGARCGRRVWEGKRVMEAGLREAALAAPQGTARRGRRGERVCGGRSCRPARHSPKGQCRGRGARRGHAWRGSAPWKRACGRCFCRPARHSPKGQCRGERVRGTACMGGEARRGSGLAEAALAAPQGTARRGSAGNHRLQSGGSPAGRPPFAACADIMRRTKQKSGALSPCRQKKP